MTMNLRVCFTVIILLSMVSCGSQVEELEDKQRAAEQKLQEAEQMQQKAEEIVQQKANFRQSRSPVDPNKQVELFGSVAVWGKQPGTMGSSQGTMVQLINKDNGRAYTAFVGSDNNFKVAVTPGQYTLTINKPGYEIHQEEITVDGTLNSQLLRPIGLKNVK
jgi:hypothetical protein